MKLDSINKICVTLTLTATDCFAISDALGTAIVNDASADHALDEALRSAFLGFAVLAAHDTITDNQVPEEEMIADTRQVWGRTGWASSRREIPLRSRPRPRECPDHTRGRVGMVLPGPFACPPPCKSWRVIPTRTARRIRGISPCRRPRQMLCWTS